MSHPRDLDEDRIAHADELDAVYAALGAEPDADAPLAKGERIADCLNCGRRHVTTAPRGVSTVCGPCDAVAEALAGLVGLTLDAAARRHADAIAANAA